MTPSFTIRNLTPTSLCLIRIESFEDPNTKQTRSGLFNFAYRSNSSVPTASELGEHVQSFYCYDLAIDLATFESYTFEKEQLKAVHQDTPSPTSSPALRLTVETSPNQRYRIALNPAYTQKSSQLCSTLTPFPSNAYTALYHPTNPIPHVTIHDNNSLDLATWMSSLPSTLPLSALSIPGSHNSHAYYRALPSVRCQVVDVKAQLEHGIRLLDIRVQPAHATDIDKKDLALVHGAFPASLTGAKYLEPILDTCYEFLQRNPKETIIISLKREGIGSATDEVLSQILDKHYIAPNRERWHTGSTLPYLGDVRGKLVLIRRYNLHDSLAASSHGYGLDATEWPDNCAHAFHGPFCVQDFYGVLNPSFIPQKLQHSNEHLVRSAECTAFIPGINTDKANPVPPGPLYLNFLSASNFFNMSCWPEKIAKVVNRGIEEWICMGHHLEDPLNTPAEPGKTSLEGHEDRAEPVGGVVRKAKPGDGSTGVVIMDNVGEGGDWDLVKMIVGMNMGPLHLSRCSTLRRFPIRTQSSCGARQRPPHNVVVVAQPHVYTRAARSHKAGRTSGTIPRHTFFSFTIQTMRDRCNFAGNADMYGIGIRLGVYITWAARVLATLISPSEVHNIQLTTGFYFTAILFALLTQVNKQPGIEVVEVYITLMAPFMATLLALPFVLFSCMIVAVRGLDYVRNWTKSTRNWTDSLTRGLAFLLLTGLQSFQLWFWKRKVRQLDSKDCQQYGFLFVPVALDSNAFRTVNVVVTSFILGFCGLMLVLRVIRYLKIWEPKRPFLEIERKYESRKMDFHGISLTLTDMAIISIVIAATECTIHWNNISGVNNIDSLARLKSRASCEDSVTKTHLCAHATNPEIASAESTTLELSVYPMARFRLWLIDGYRIRLISSWRWWFWIPQPHALHRSERHIIPSAHWTWSSLQSTIYNISGLIRWSGHLMSFDMETCTFVGNADMYGLGIRLGYYLQWHGSLLAAWVCRREVPALRITNIFFVASTFLALVVQVSKGKDLQVVEIYITLLFTFGSSLQLLPVLLWRLVTCCNPMRDPSRFPKTKPPSAVFTACYNLLLIAVLTFQIWFWISKVPVLDTLACKQFGFLFTRIQLRSRAFGIVNVVLSAVLLALLVGYAAAGLYQTQTKKLAIISKSDFSPRMIKAYTILNSVSKFIVASTIVIATELCIKWNRITGVNDINSAGQMIPLVIGVGSVVRILYMAAYSLFSDKYDSDSDSDSGHIAAFHDLGPTLPCARRPDDVVAPWYDMDQPMPVAWKDDSNRDDHIAPFYDDIGPVFPIVTSFPPRQMGDE
ncbi:hypothetical protein BDV96DRAFT_605573 [Lophiotrema nucula]|uniref:Phosphatidylinositol-specific phospholipase C X domain-containing protein n=1 Tax=Lophiotrema nucula TaxID=690887 RepID=A0A6A5YQU4_9PLEO|nr:hypothetical protein BDV96DRAFT_605573 [Lophiotrema nucula]